MSVFARALVVIVGFIAGFAIISALFTAFQKKPASQSPASIDEYYRELLGVSVGAKQQELWRAFQNRSSEYRAVADTSPDFHSCCR